MNFFHTSTLATFALAATMTLATLASGCGAQSFNQKLTGRWTSATCEPAGPNLYVKRDFTLTDASWQLDVGIFNDAACAAKFVGIGVAGPYKVGQDSTAVPGATEVDYLVSTHTVTPASDTAVQTLTQGNCGTGTRTVGQPVDVTQTDCTPLGIPSIAACPMELDLNKIDGDNLYFGDRTNDLCKARPAKLGTTPVVRAK